MSRDILRAIRKKKRVWKKIKNGQITPKYWQIEKEVKNMIRNAKRKFEKRLATEN